MSEPNLDPLPPEILELLQREKVSYSEDPSLKAAVLAGVEAAVLGLGPSGGGGGAGGSSAATGKSAAAATFGAKAVSLIAAGAFVVGGVAGGLTVRSVASSPLPSSPTSASVDPVREVLPPISTTQPPPIDSAKPMIPSSSPSAAVKTIDARGDLTKERELLDVARASLSRGNSNDAIAAAERHAQRWPHGYLVEEREVIWIQALAASGRRSEANQRATFFRRTFPSSLLISAIDAAIGKDAGP